MKHSQRLASVDAGPEHGRPTTRREHADTFQIDREGLLPDPWQRRGEPRDRRIVGVSQEVQREMKLLHRYRPHARNGMRDQRGKPPPDVLRQIDRDEQTVRHGCGADAVPASA